MATRLIVPVLLILVFAVPLHAQIECTWGLNVRVVGPDEEALKSAKVDLEGDRVPPRHLVDGFVSWGHARGTGPRGTYRLIVQAKGYKKFETHTEFPICDMHYYQVELQRENDRKGSEAVMLSSLRLNVAPYNSKSRPFDRIELVDDAGVGKSLILKRNYLSEVIHPGDYEIKGFTAAGDLVFTIPSLELKEGTVFVEFRFPEYTKLRDAFPVTTCDQIENGDRQLKCVVVL